MPDEKLFKLRGETWEGFCRKYLGLSKSFANRIIRWLDEFGPEYFELAQLTRITADRLAGMQPGVPRAIAAATVTGTLTAVVTYRLLRR